MEKLINKVKIIVIMLIAILTIFATNVKAEDAKGTDANPYTIYEVLNGNNQFVGNVVSVTTADLTTGSNNLYCVQHNVPFSGGNYTISKFLGIRGCWDTVGQTTNPSIYTAMLGYIFNQANGLGYGTAIGAYSKGQIALYHTYNDWYNNVVKGHEEAYNNGGSVIGPTEANTVVPFTTESQAIYNESVDYANFLYNYEVSGITITDKTNKNNISVTPYVHDSNGYLRVGPFNWNFSGTVDEVEVYSEGDSKISSNNVLFSKFEGTTESFINKTEIKSDENFYISVKMNANHTNIKKIKVKVKFPTATRYGADIWFLTNLSQQNLILVKPTQDEIQKDDTKEFAYNINLTKKIKIYKVDSRDTTIPLDGVGFVLKNNEMDKYVKKSGSKITYVSEKRDATTFYTDRKGKLNISGVLIGNYTAYETKNPHYGYVVSEQEPVTIPYQRTETTKITNYQRYIKLSGYIWLDVQDEKQTVSNDLYKNDKYDTKDKSFNGIKVKLKDKDGNIVKAGTKTGTELTGEEQIKTSKERGLYSEIDGGEYVFGYVTIDELANYHIEFEYDGLVYKSVAMGDWKVKNASKATDKEEREILDKNFTSIDSTGKNQVSVNNGKYNIYYNDTVNHATSIIEKTTTTESSVNFVKDDSDCILHANTQYNFKKSFSPTMEEIKYINLGLWQKPQADLALAQDLANVNVGVNGYWHIYNYGSRLNAGNKNGVFANDSNSWNVGVKFKNDYTGSYKRAVYKADYEYENNDKSKEMQVYLTYKIGLRNESTYLTKVNNIMDYFDNRYEFIAAGTGLNNNNEITGKLDNDSATKYNDEYQQVKIYTNTNVEAGQTNYIFVQFKLNKDAVRDIVNKKETLYNVSEINSYTVYQDDKGTTVAAVDRDSVPGNATIGKIDTYEDDIDSAPPIQLELANARRVEGTVFLDSTNNELNTGNIRQGDGIFNDRETTIKGVKVTFHELNNSIPDKEVITDDYGNFEFDEYIPGQYIITYTWGDKTYKVQNYKGTIYQANRDQNNMYWYKDNDQKGYAPRYTDAIDDYKQRLTIDKQTADITDSKIYNIIEEAYNGNNPQNIITTMDSVTPTMEFSVEYETIETDGTGNEVVFTIPNVDFGIVERARQQLDMEKKVHEFKITLANGQILVDAIVDGNGNLQGSHNHVTYMAPSINNGIADKGYIKAEVDNELLEGASLDLTYNITAINNSEMDYMSERYYKYGIVEGNPVTLTPSAVVDYLNANLVFEQDKNPDWKHITVEELTNMNPVKFQLGNADYINSKTILYTEATAQPLKPKETKIVSLNVSKLLTTTSDLTFDNETETVKINKPNQQITPTGSIVRYFPGADAEDVRITPSTGENRNYALPITIGIVAFSILGIGIVLIKKRVIDNK